ncbi:hypothetical protein ACQKML_26035 [Peribacillus frigoritolerans]
MDNIKANYKALLVEFEVSSQLFQEKGYTRLLNESMSNLERFEQSFIRAYGLESLIKLKHEVSEKGVLIA